MYVWIIDRRLANYRANMDMASAKTTDMLDESRQNDPEDQDRILRRSEREQPEKNQKARRTDRWGGVFIAGGCNSAKKPG